AVVFWFLGDFIARILYGAAFAESGDLLFKLSLAYLPWITAWGVFIRLIARGSRPAVVVLAVAAVLQLTGFLIAVPDRPALLWVPAVTALLWVQAIIGIAVLVSFFVLVRLLDRPTSAPSIAAAAKEPVA